ncbi:unnamed protein product [Alternaria alternata]
MALPTKYAAAVAVFMSTVSAIPLNVIEGSKFKPRSDINYIDQSDISNLTAQLGLEKRQAGCGGRPSGVSGIAICGPDFVNMGDKGWGPALAAMPQWNHARLNDFERPCYPESAADANGDGPAPGVSADASDGVAVGSKRRDSNGGKPYSGPLMRNAPFPMYVDGVYYPGDTT